MKELMEMLEKKNSSKNHGEDYESKMQVLKELRDMADSLIGGDLDSMKKVTVAAKDEKGLKKGLSKAKELLENMPK